VGCELLRKVLDVGRYQMVGNCVTEQVEPEERNPREYLALERDGVGKHDVERADPIRGDYEQAIAEVVDVSHLALGVGAKVIGREHWGPLGGVIQDEPPPRL